MRLIDIGRVLGLMVFRLSKCLLSTTACQVLATALISEHCKLEILYLESNLISSQGIKHISRALEQNRTLEILNLHSNSIRDEGSQALALAVTSSRIRNLELTSNRISDAGMLPWLDTIYHSRLIHFSFSLGNFLHPDTVHMLRRALLAKNSFPFKVCMLLCCVRDLPWADARPICSLLPKDLIHRLGETLPIGDES